MKALVIILVTIVSTLSSASPQTREQLRVTARDGRPGGHFGRAVDIAGDYAIIGSAPAPDSMNGGAAYLFKRMGTTWQEVVRLTSGATGDGANEFGSCVSLAGDYAIVGAPGEGTGAAFIFKREGGWRRQATLQIAEAAHPIRFGAAVSIEGDHAIVGAERDTVKGDTTGAAYIFRQVAGEWIQQARLVASDGQNNDLFGHAVDMSGDYAVVGAPQGHAPRFDHFNEGIAYIFANNGGEWTEQARLQDERQIMLMLGHAVALDNTQVIVGGPFSINDPVSGGALIFKREQQQWLETAFLFVPAIFMPEFGYSVDLTGSRAIVGAPNDADFQIDRPTGSAFLFRRENEQWTLQARLRPAVQEAQDRFGAALAISDGHILAGVPNDDEQGEDAGAAYFFSDEVPVSVDDGPAPEQPGEFSLLQNYPNPFNPATSITYRLTQPAQVRLSVFNLTGQEVAILVSERQAQGTHVVTWQGRDQTGKPVSSGLYLYRLQVGSSAKARSMLLLK